MSCGKVAEGNEVIEPKGEILVSGLVGSVSGAGIARTRTESIIWNWRDWSLLVRNKLKVLPLPFGKHKNGKTFIYRILQPSLILLQRFRQLRNHLKRISYHTIIGSFEEGRFRVFVDHDNDFGVVHAGEVLYSA
jgi:hypothetical protein